MLRRRSIGPEARAQKGGHDLPHSVKLKLSWLIPGSIRANHRSGERSLIQLTVLNRRAGLQRVSLDINQIE